MSLGEKAGRYYADSKKGCGVAIALAARDVFGIELTDTETIMLTGFNGGMGCKSTCGALTGSIAVLSKMYSTRDDIRTICADYVTVFTQKMGCNSIECGVLEEKYRTVEDRCVKTVELAGDILEDFINGIEGVDKSRNVDLSGCTIDPADIKRVKGDGFLNQKGTNKFNGRILTRNGKITDEEAMYMSEAARRFGDGHMMLTTRLTMEISGIDYENIEPFKEYIGQIGLITGGTGSKVRPVVACKSTTCQYGLYDAYALSDKIHNRFYLGYHNVNLPHKFKIALGGCPNNCVKPNLNDLGVIGARIPEFNEEICKGCKKCQVEQTCPIKVAKVEDGKLVIDPEKCNNCGRCVGKCPFGALETGKYGWKIYVGGRWGKNVAHGQMIRKIFTSEEEVLDTIEKAILLFRSLGNSGERFADTIARIGFDEVERLLLSNELLEKKDEILGLDVVGGATC